MPIILAPKNFNFSFSILQDYLLDITTFYKFENNVASSFGPLMEKIGLEFWTTDGHLLLW